MYGIWISRSVAAMEIEAVRGKFEEKLKKVESPMLTVFLLDESAAAVSAAQNSLE